MSNIKKITRIGTVLQGNRYASIYINIEYRRDYLSITGVIGPLSSGNALGGCGQICMEFKHRNKKDDDKRYSNYLIKPCDIHFQNHWNKETWFDLLDIWEKWHMKEIIPHDVIAWINNLPDTDRHPAWV